MQMLSLILKNHVKDIFKLKKISPDPDLVHGGVLVKIDGVAGDAVDDPHGVEVGVLPVTAPQSARQHLDDALNIDR